tara:strand:+ start:3010 stop:3882 length:873 start_codon:yes stop_codon:yes gene_type:complete
MVKKKEEKKDLLFFKKFLINFVYQELDHEKNFEAYDQEEWREPLDHETRSINTDTEKLASVLGDYSWYDNTNHEKILPLNFGKGIDPDEWDVNDFVGDINEPSKQDLIRHINVTGMYENKWDENKLEIKNFFSESFTINQAEILNIIFRSLEVKNFKLSKKLDEAEKTIKDFRQAEKDKSIYDRLDQIDKLVKENIFDQLDHLYYSNYAEGKKTFDPLKIGWLDYPDGEKKFKERYESYKSQLSNWVANFHVAFQKIINHPQRKKDIYWREDDMKDIDKATNPLPDKKDD